MKVYTQPDSSVSVSVVVSLSLSIVRAVFLNSEVFLIGSFSFGIQNPPLLNTPYIYIYIYIFVETDTLVPLCTGL